MDARRITKTEIKNVKWCFEYLNKQKKLVQSRGDSLNEKEINDYEKEYRINRSMIGEAIARLMEYEMPFERIKKSLADVACEDLLLDAVEDANQYYYKNKIRIPEKKHVSEREAKKELKIMCKKITKNNGLLSRVLFSDEVERTAEEFVYKFRDWLIYGIDNLIDEIEPARQQYILSKQGMVTVDEVEEYLTSKFEVYELYSDWVLDRQAYEIIYYPGLKLD